MSANDVFKMQEVQSFNKHKQGKASTVLPNKRQTHEKLPETLYHRSTVFKHDKNGKLTSIESFTARHHGERRPTPKQRAKATKAMMETRRNPNGGK